MASTAWSTEVKGPLGRMKMGNALLDLLQDLSQHSYSPELKLLTCSVRSLWRQAETDFDQLRRDQGEDKAPEEKHEEQSW